jgi:hypothetical protein
MFTAPDSHDAHDYAEQSETASTARRVLLRKRERSEANDDMVGAR